MTLHRIVRGVLLGLSGAGLLLAGFLSMAWSATLVDSALDYGPPALQVEPIEGSWPPLADALALVILEGAPAHWEARLPTLERFGQAGAVVRLDPAPASLPPEAARAILLTGAMPEMSGMWRSYGLLRAEHIFDVLSRAGRRAGVYGPAWWSFLSEEQLRRRVIFGTERDAGAAPLRQLAQEWPGEALDFAVAHLIVPAGAGESWYTAVDASLGELLRAVDPTRQALWVLILPRWQGEDGILVAYGAAVRGGEDAPARLVDIAPTAAAVLGLPAPAWSEGHFIPALLAGPEAPRAAAWAALARGRENVARAYAAGIGSTRPLPRLDAQTDALEQALDDGEWDRAISLASELLSRWDDAMRSAYRARLWQGRLARAWMPFLYIAILLFVLWRARRRRAYIPLLPAMVGVVASLLGIFCTYVLAGAGTLTHFPARGMPAAVFAVAGMALAWGGAFAFSPNAQARGARLGLSLRCGWWVLALHGIIIIGLTWWNGAIVSWRLPPLWEIWMQAGMLLAAGTSAVSACALAALGLFWRPPARRGYDTP